VRMGGVGGVSSSQSNRRGANELDAITIKVWGKTMNKVLNEQSFAFERYVCHVQGLGIVDEEAALT
jgi:hypothetical protein